MFHSIAFFIIAYLAFAISGLLFRIDQKWYSQLKKPKFTPPNKAFGIAWGIIYAFIALSLTIVHNKVGLFNTSELYFYALLVNYVANQAYSYLFFAKKDLRLAFLDTILILLSGIVLVYATLPYSTLAAILLIPYVLWTSFALYLSYGIYTKNKDTNIKSE